MKKTDFVLMRKTFAECIHKQMQKNDKIYVLVNDLGYKMWDKIRADFPDRFINVGASEQSLIGIAVGLAISGKIPIAYSITTFLLYRPFETIRNYLHYEKIGVKMVGAGRDKDYLHDGISHWALEDKKIMKILNNIESYWPNKITDIEPLVKKMISDSKPWYINLRR